MENSKFVKLGDGVGNEIKNNINNNISELAKVFMDMFFEYLKDKVKNIPQELQNFLDNSENKQEIVAQWSNEIFEKGLIPKGYRGLPDGLLISNFHQDGYISGLYVGYIISMMSMVDHNAEEDLILAVRDDMRANLIGNAYSEQYKFIDKYKDSSYSWIEKD